MYNRYLLISHYNIIFQTKIFAQTTKKIPEWITVLKYFANLKCGSFLFVSWFMGFGIGLIFTFLFWHLQVSENTANDRMWPLTLIIDFIVMYHNPCLGLWWISDAFWCGFSYQSHFWDICVLFQFQTHSPDGARQSMNILIFYIDSIVTCPISQDRFIVFRYCVWDSSATYCVSCTSLGWRTHGGYCPLNSCKVNKIVNFY